jgi:hypothetical protein
MLTSAIAVIQWFFERHFNIELARPAPGTTAIGRLFGRGRIVAAAPAIVAPRGCRGAPLRVSAAKSVWLASVSGAVEEPAFAAAVKRGVSLQAEIRGDRVASLVPRAGPRGESRGSPQSITGICVDPETQSASVAVVH